MIRKIAFTLIFLCFSLYSFTFALFDTGTAMDKGKIELDVAINPFESVNYGQNFVFGHYGLGNGYEIHGYFSKWGTIFNWDNSTYESYIGILKQWVSFEQLDLATSVGIRNVYLSGDVPDLFGPGILYTWKISKLFRIAGHINYIAEIINQENRITLNAYGAGYTWEVGFYYLLTPGFELAFGAFTNTLGNIRPIYTLNFYL